MKNALVVLSAKGRGSTRAWRTLWTIQSLLAGIHLGTVIVDMTLPSELEGPGWLLSEGNGGRPAPTA